MQIPPEDRMNLSRRNVLKLAATLSGASAIGPAAALLEPDAAQAQTPKRGGGFRIRGEDPVSGLDPHLVVNHHRIATHLSFTHSRLVRVKSGPQGQPNTLPLQPPLRE